MDAEMLDAAHERSVRLIASQLDAASTLLKFAADDLESLVERARSIFHDDVLLIVANLQSVAGRLNDQATFISRLDVAEARGRPPETSALRRRKTG